MIAAATIKPPTFSARRDYPSATGFVSVADINGDGIPDVIAVNYAITTLLGSGTGTFSVGPTTNSGWNDINGGVPIDLNGDSKIDLVVSGGPNGAAVPSGVGICFGNGDGTFQTPVLYQAGSDKLIGYPTVGDFNGDGIPDVVVAGESGVWLFTGKGAGVFNPGVLTPVNPPEATAGAAIAVADFNGDRNLDLAVTFYVFHGQQGFLVFFGNGNGTFNAPVFYGGTDTGWIGVGDLSGNGRPDIVLSGPSVYLNNGHGGFSGPRPVALPGGGRFAIGDVNGDGIPDLVSLTGYVALGLGGAKFAPPVYYPVETSGSSINVALGNLSKNGLTDIVAGENSAVSVLLNRGNGTFVDGEWTSVPGSGNCGAAADFNGDGIPDLAVPTIQGITVLFGTGKAKSPYTTGPSFAVSGVGCPITGDLNGDGIPDLLVGANGLGGVGAYLGNGDGTFSLAGVIPVGPATNIVLGDFNHDGIPDFADSSNELALGNGDGTFQAPVAITASPPLTGFLWIAAGDVNNDGWTDIVGTPALDGEGLSVLLNNHQGGWTQSSINANGPSVVMLADLNGDGNLDAVTMASDIGASILLGNGQGGFKLTQKNIAYPGPDINPPQIGDVNGDGIPDLVLAADGSIGIALGTGKGTFLTPFVVGAGPGLGQIFMQNLHGQAASAGLPDLSAPDSTGGVTVLINLTK